VATEFIAGESRQAFQNSLESYLKRICAPWGISLNSVLIRDIFAPQEVASIIRARELAVQEAKKIDQQIVQAKSLAELGRQKSLAERNSKVVAAQTERIQRKIAAEQNRAEVTIAAETRLKVAATDLKAAEAESASRLAKAEANRKVVEARTVAEAAVMKQEISVYQNERDYLRARLYEKTAPRISDVVTADDPREMLGIPVKTVFSKENGGVK
jgi:regulator of protease activity HflC (stomatin/prohibitin superfamily)